MRLLGSSLANTLWSQGLVGVFDHDFVDTSSDKSQLHRKMEDDAKKNAREAKDSLEESYRASGGSAFNPTFTGRFGGSGGASLLAKIQARNREIQGEGRGGRLEGTEEIGKTVKEGYKTMMKRVKRFVIEKGGEVGGGPTTKELLREFRDVGDSQAATFKAILHIVARLEGGRWLLKTDDQDDLAY